jgi:hypothetical protein
MASTTSEYRAQLAQASADIELLVRRFQSLSEQGWETRRDSVLYVLGRLAEMSGALEQRTMPPLPELASFALADAFAVLGGDVLVVLESRDVPGVLNELVDVLRQARAATK